MCPLVFVFFGLQALWAPYNRMWLVLTVGSLLGGMVIVAVVSHVTKRKHGDIESRFAQRSVDTDFCRLRR
jgi:formate/nitrite transporter FocA (FNT family)